MTRVFECDSEHIMFINVRNSTICVSASIMEFIFDIPPVQNHVNAGMSCDLLYYSVVCCGLCHPLQSNIASVGFYHCHCRWFPVG